MVDGKYTNDQWLGMNNAPGEWAVVYHGTPACNAASIVNLQTYLDKVTQYGNGIYCSPFVDAAEQYCNVGGSDILSLDTTEGKVSFKLTFMCRANPAKVTKWTDKIWTVASADDIRPYGVLIKRVN